MKREFPSTEASLYQKFQCNFVLLTTFFLGLVIPFQNLSLYRNFSIPDLFLLILLLLLCVSRTNDIAKYISSKFFLIPLIFISIGNLIIIIVNGYNADYAINVIFGYAQVILCILVFPLILTFSNLKYFLHGLIISSTILAIAMLLDRFNIFRFVDLVSYKGYQGYRASLIPLMQEQNATALFFSIIAVLIITHGKYLFMSQSLKYLLFALYLFVGLVTLSRSYIIFVILLFVGLVPNLLRRKFRLLHAVYAIFLFSILLIYRPTYELLYNISLRVGELAINDGSYLERANMYLNFIPEFLEHYIFVGAGFSTDYLFELNETHSSIHNIIMDFATRGSVFGAIGIITVIYYYSKEIPFDSRIKLLLMPYFVYFTFLPFLMTRALWVGLAVACHTIYHRKKFALEDCNDRRYTIVHYANTIVGKKGNIGIRTAQILKHLSKKNYSIICVCRGTVCQFKNVNIYSMGVLGYVPRMLNAYRIYVSRKYNHRLHDIKIFTIFSQFITKFIINTNEIQIAHLWDNCPALIRQLKNKGISVILDVPIAPLSYCVRLKSSGKAPFLDSDRRMIEIEHESFRLADHILVPSTFVRDELVMSGIPIEKLSIVEFGVKNINNFQLSKPNKDIRNGLDFVFLGVVNARKGIPELLSAWDCEEFSNDRLHLCGRIYPEMYSLFKSTRGGKIIRPGFINPESYLNQCDVFVFPSWMEGSAKAILEAMAHGIPAIVTTSSGSVIRDGVDGFVINPGDSNAIREKMIWFKENIDKINIMGSAGRVRAAEFSQSAYAEKVISVYRKLSAGLL